MMGIVVLLTLGLVAALIVLGVFKATDWHRRPAELRGDWWNRFERQFRAYARAVESQRGHIH